MGLKQVSLVERSSLCISEGPLSEVPLRVLALTVAYTFLVSIVGLLPSLPKCSVHSVYMYVYHLNVMMMSCPVRGFVSCQSVIPVFVLHVHQPQLPLAIPYTGSQTLLPLSLTISLHTCDVIHSYCTFHISHIPDSKYFATNNVHIHCICAYCTYIVCYKLIVQF